MRLTLTLAVFLGAVGSVVAQSDVKEHPRPIAVVIAVAPSDVKEKTRPILDVEGNKVFSKQELTDTANKYLDGWAGNGHKYDPSELDYCLHILTNLIKSRGYLQARVDRGKVEETEAGSRVVLAVKEGPLYRVGESKIEGARLFSPEQIRETIGLNTGEVANGQALSEGLFERLKNSYGKFGYIQYTADVQPTFHVKENASEGVADFDITIDEGAQFKIRSIKFIGGDEQSRQYLGQQLLLREGDVFVDDLLRESVKRINDTHSYEPIDADKDVDYRTNEEAALVDLTIHLKKSVVAAANR
jgi:outer membrane protein assembly factor BamA